MKNAVFTLYTDANPATVANDSETSIDGDDTPVTRGGNNVTCPTNSSGACSFASVNQGDYWVVETTTPSGYQTAPPQEATIGIGGAPGTGPTVNLTFVDPAAPATINVVETDPVGTGLAGAVFQLYQGSVASGTPVASCTTGDGTNGTTLGDCSFGQFVGTGSATYTIHEQTPPTGYSGCADQTFTFTYTNSPQTITKTFTDSPVPGTITIQKNDDASPANPIGGATFGLYADTELAVANDSATAPDGDDLAVKSGTNDITCTTNSSGSCSFSNVVPPGTYAVFETATPSGYQTAPAQDVTVGLGTSPGSGSNVTLTFVDPRLHKVIALVCSEGTNTLDSSDVTFDGGATQQSLDAGAAPSGTTEATLCGLGGAAKSDLADGATSNAQIVVH